MYFPAGSGGGLPFGRHRGVVDLALVLEEVHVAWVVITRLARDRRCLRFRRDRASRQPDCASLVLGARLNQDWARSRIGEGERAIDRSAPNDAGAVEDELCYDLGAMTS